MRYRRRYFHSLYSAQPPVASKIYIHSRYFFDMTMMVVLRARAIVVPRRRAVMESDDDAKRLRARLLRYCCHAMTRVPMVNAAARAQCHAADYDAAHGGCAADEPSGSGCRTAADATRSRSPRMPTASVIDAGCLFDTYALMRL